MTQKPFLNLGCGRVILPAPRPDHHNLVDEAIYAYALWHNVDRNGEPGVDEVVDIFRYPFPWADNSFDGALCSHLVEHIPHEIKTRASGWQSRDSGGLHFVSPDEVWGQAFQDGWYAFFAELHRVLTPGSIIHVLAPYGWSQGAITDPTHTRMITEHSFTHSMQPDPNSPFKYATGGLNLELVEPVGYNIIPDLWGHLLPAPEDAPDVLAAKNAQLMRAFQTQINVAYECYAKLRVVK